MVVRVRFDAPPTLAEGMALQREHGAFIAEAPHGVTFPRGWPSVVTRITDAPKSLRPFWGYYGGKWRAAPRYPKPRHRTIVEPFAGAAGYSLRYADHDVVLVEKYPVIAEMWRWLIAASPAEVRSVPIVDHVDELPAWVPEGARSLVGFAMNGATVSPRKRLSAGLRKLRDGRCKDGYLRRCVGWSPAVRDRAASQVDAIKHWRVIEGDYRDAPNIEATWFVDPPYNNRAGRCYVHSDLDYPTLGQWCRERRGQVIVCENEGATWLPFRRFATLKPGVNGKGSREVIWTDEDEATTTEAQPMTGSETKSHEFLWLDLETTGLDPHSGLLLEFAAVLCEDGAGDDFAIVQQFEGVVHHESEAIKAAKPDLCVMKMHHANGLWKACRESDITLAEVDAFLAALASQLSGGRKRAITLAGSSVHFDLAWCRVHLPQFAAYLSHRVLDVSTLRRAIDTWAPAPVEWPKRDTHRAMADVLATIEEARIARKAMFGGAS